MPGETLTIGSDRDNDIVADSGYISRFHARLIREGIRLYLEDLESANHTYLNGIEVRGLQRIQPGDSIQLSKQWTLDWDDPAILKWLMPDPFRHRAEDCENGCPGSTVFPHGPVVRERGARPARESVINDAVPQRGRGSASRSGPARKGCLATVLAATLPTLAAAAALMAFHHSSLDSLASGSRWLP